MLPLYHGRTVLTQASGANTLVQVPQRDPVFHQPELLRLLSSLCSTRLMSNSMNMKRVAWCMIATHNGSPDGVHEGRHTRVRLELQLRCANNAPDAQIHYILFAKKLKYSVPILSRRCASPVAPSLTDKSYPPPSLSEYHALWSRWCESLCVWAAGGAGWSLFLGIKRDGGD